MQSKDGTRKRFALYGFAMVVCWGVGLCSAAILPFADFSPAIVGWMKVTGVVALVATLALLFFKLEQLRFIFDTPAAMAAVIACVTLATAILALTRIMEIPAIVCFLAYFVAGVAGAIIFARWAAAYARYHLEAHALPAFLSVAAGLGLCALLSMIPAPLIRSLCLCLLPLVNIPFTSLHINQPETWDIKGEQSASMKRFMKMIRETPMIHGALMPFIAGVGIAQPNGILPTISQEALLIGCALFLGVALLGKLAMDNMRMSVIHRPVAILFAPALLMLPFVMSPNRDLSCAVAIAGMLLFLTILWVATSDISNMIDLDFVGFFSMRFSTSVPLMLCSMFLGEFVAAHFGFDSKVTMACLVVVAALLMFTAIISMEDQEVVQDALSPRVVDEAKKQGMTLEEACAALGHRLDLSAREIEVFTLLAQGRDPVRIQDTLFISYNTVRNHIKSIYRKLGVHSRQELLDLVEGELTR